MLAFGRRIRPIIERRLLARYLLNIGVKKINSERSVMNISKLQVGTDGLFRRDSIGQAEQENMRIKNPKDEKNLTSQQTSPEDHISISDIWHDVARTIDVRHAAPREIIALSSQLYKAGAISYDDHINLSFQPENDQNSPEKSKPFSHGKRDYIELWRSKQENVIRHGGDRNQIEDIHRIQAILIYIDSLK